MAMARFTLPRDIYFGSGAMEQLGHIKGRRRAFVVTGGRAMQSTGFLDKLVNILKSGGMEVKTFEGVEPDPSVTTVMSGAAAMKEFSPDLIVAIGGGSPIDAAKAMWVFYEHPELTFEDIKTPFSLPPLRQKALFAAVPSTSGTATEVTAFSVITDYTTKVKYPLADFELTPDIAIVDTDIAKTMPRKLAAHTGMDALTHAIEAYTATQRSHFSDPLALQAISMVFDDLLDSYNGNEAARERMHIAQCLAGMAFSNALLGITHSIAHKIGAQFNISHGCCNAILLPYVIQFNSKVCMKDYACIARHLGLPGYTDKQLTDSLVRAVKKLGADVGIAPTLRDNGVADDDFTCNINFISEQAALDPCTGSNPREATAIDIKSILVCALTGMPVSF